MVVCQGANGEKTVAQTFANAFNRPVVASTSDIILSANAVDPYAVAIEHNGNFYANTKTGYPVTVKGDFMITYPNDIK